MENIQSKLYDFLVPLCLYLVQKYVPIEKMLLQMISFLQLESTISFVKSDHI
jgi:hypothetical protein